MCCELYEIIVFSVTCQYKMDFTVHLMTRVTVVVPLLVIQIYCLIKLRYFNKK